MSRANAPSICGGGSARGVAGAPRTWLRLEGAATCAAAVIAYARGGHSWLAFAVLFLSPDLSILAYLAGPRLGSAGYNLIHSYVGPAIAAGALLAAGGPLGVPLIWAAHIGFDRALGYGLKYADGFPFTHLGRIGRTTGGSSGVDGA
jgi:hypothetical protein